MIARSSPAIVMSGGVGDAIVARTPAGDLVVAEMRADGQFVSVLARDDLRERWAHPAEGVPIVAPDGDVVVTLPHAGVEDTVTIGRLAAADGAERWRAALPLLALGFSSSAHATSVVIAADGDVVVAGSIRTPKGYDAVVLRLTGDTGVVRWTYRLDPADAVSDGAGDMVVGALGDVFLSAFLVPGPSAAVEDVLVAVDGTAGTERWRRVVAVDAAERGATVASHPSGDVVASIDAPTALHVARYAASDGDVVWESRTEFAPLTVLVYQLMVDPSGDAIAVGAIADAYAAKLDGAGGTLRWFARALAGADVTPMVGYAAVVDPSGDVLVAGQVVHPTATCGDFAIARADGGTGALVTLDGVDGSATASNCVQFACGEGAHCSPHPRAGIDTDRASSIVLAADGSVVAGGYLNQLKGTGDSTVVVFSDRLRGDFLTIRRGRLRLRSSDPHILAPLPDGPGDPTRFDGYVEARDERTGAVRMAPLLAGNWRVRRRPGHGTATYRYSAARGACTKGIVRDGSRLELRCDARFLGVSDGDTAIRITFGSGSRYCLEFGGSLVRDGAGEVERRDAPAPVACR
jgi:outer membrane protein assembly factor BamB